MIWHTIHFTSCGWAYRQIRQCVFCGTMPTFLWCTDLVDQRYCWFQHGLACSNISLDWFPGFTEFRPSSNVCNDWLYLAWILALSGLPVEVSGHQIRRRPQWLERLHQGSGEAYRVVLLSIQRSKNWEWRGISYMLLPLSIGTGTLESMLFVYVNIYIYICM